MGNTGWIMDATRRERDGRYRTEAQPYRIRSDCAGRWRGSLVYSAAARSSIIDVGAYSVEPHIKVRLFQHNTLYKGFPAILVKLFCTRGGGRQFNPSLGIILSLWHGTVKQKQYIDTASDTVSYCTVLVLYSSVVERSYL